MQKPINSASPMTYNEKGIKHFSNRSPKLIQAIFLINASIVYHHGRLNLKLKPMENMCYYSKKFHLT